MKKKIMIPLIIVVGALLMLSQKIVWKQQLLQQKPGSQSSCNHLRTAIDMGSGSTRIRMAIVDSCLQKIISDLAYKKVSIDFLREGLQEAEGHKTLKAEFIKTAKDTILETLASVKSEGLKSLEDKPELQSFKTLKEEITPTVAVATASLRGVENADELIKPLAEKQVIVKVISQDEEGKVAFAGVMGTLEPTSEDKVEAVDIVSWDIGGGSQQVMGYSGGGSSASSGANESDPWLKYGSPLASVKMNDFILREIKHVLAVQTGSAEPKGVSAPVSANPILKSGPSHDLMQRDRTQLEEKVKQFVEGEISSLLAETWWQSRKNHFYGLGGVHGGILSALKLTAGHENDKSYGLAELNGLLDKVLYMDDSAIEMEYKIPKAYSGLFASNVLLVKEMMEVLGLQRLNVVNVDNTQGVLVSPTYWAN